MSTQHRKVQVQGGQRGFTLIEILIALLIGVFLLGALLTIVQANRRVYGDQSQLAQLQDDERMAMTLMTDIIQMAGYFPAPQTNTVGSLAPATPFAQGQSIFGTSSTTAPGDSISVRYETAGSDGVLNCSGLSNQNAVGGANILYVNTFEVSNGQLVCILTSSAAPAPVQYNLVSGVTNNSTDAPLTNVGVQNLTILYGVNTSGAGNNVDTYKTASQMTTADWSSVISVLIELTFTNPLYTTGSTTQPQTIEIQRVVGVMNQLGPVN